MKNWRKYNPRKEGYYFWKPDLDTKRWWVVYLVKLSCGWVIKGFCSEEHKVYGYFGGKIELPKEFL